MSEFLELREHQERIFSSLLFLSRAVYLLCVLVTIQIIAKFFTIARWRSFSVRVEKLLTMSERHGNLTDQSKRTMRREAANVADTMKPLMEAASQNATVVVQQVGEIVKTQVTEAVQQVTQSVKAQVTEAVQQAIPSNPEASASGILKGQK